MMSQMVLGQLATMYIFNRASLSSLPHPHRWHQGHMLVTATLFCLPFLLRSQCLNFPLALYSPCWSPPPLPLFPRLVAED